MLRIKDCVMVMGMSPVCRTLYIHARTRAEKMLFRRNHIAKLTYSHLVAARKKQRLNSSYTLFCGRHIYLRGLASRMESDEQRHLITAQDVLSLICVDINVIGRSLKDIYHECAEKLTTDIIMTHRSASFRTLVGKYFEAKRMKSIVENLIPRE